MNDIRKVSIPLNFLRSWSERMRSVGLLLLLGLVIGSGASAVSAAERDDCPNVVLIIADDLGYAELGCYGQKWIKTPHIDQLAAEGMLFTQHYSGNAVCAPSRCCLMTGKHSGHASTRNNGDPLFDPELKEKMGWEFPGQNPIPDEEVTIAEVLKQKNYATGAMGKWGLGHFGTTGDPNLQGFDLFYGYNSQRHAHNHYPSFLWRNRTKEPQPGNSHTETGETFSQDQFGKEAIAFIQQNQDRPFFLYLPFVIPHLAIQAPEESVAPYRGVISEEEYEHKSKGYAPHATPRAGYAAMISHMDEVVGSILRTLKELDLDENTIVLFTSDNGPAYDRLGGTDSVFFHSAGPFRGFKGSLYEGGIRIPLIFRWPGHIPAGTTSDHVSAFWDLLPTIADLTDTQAPAGLDGLSFAPELLQKGRQPDHEFLYWEFPAYGGQQAIRMGNWKGIYQNLVKSKGQAPFELYNLVGDPGETQDVAAEFPEIVEKMQSILKRERVPSQIFPFPALDKKLTSAYR